MIGSTEFLAYTGPTDVCYPVDGSAGPRVLEVGAGAGSGTLHLLGRLPSVRIVCLEPDDAARNALLWRLVDHPERDRVSVLPLTLEQAGPLGPFDLVVSNHVVCQVPVASRPRFWSSLRGVLAPDGVALFDSHLGRTAATPTARRRSAEGRNGDYTVSRWFTLEEHGSGLRVRNEYVMTAPDGSVVHRDERSEDVEVVSDEDALRQISDAGLAVTNPGDGWLRITPRTPSASDRCVPDASVGGSAS